MRRILFFFILLIGAGLIFEPTNAHEVRPAVLSVESSGDHHTVIWTQPVNQGRRLKIVPVFPDQCLRGDPQISIEGQSVREVFSLTCDLTTGVIRFDGLERTLTDVFVRIKDETGEVRAGLVKPVSRIFDLSIARPPAAHAYFNEGIWHILMGWDHLLFVIGLCLLVRPRQIIGVATSFTLAHSLTLALSTFGVFSLPSRPVEILIAASILLLAVEIMRRLNGQSGLTAERPYLISFGIGLIHGLGFAGALADLGLPQGQEWLALLLFNFGVEAGQIMIIAGVMIIGWVGYRLVPKFNRSAVTLTSYAIGTVAAYWMVERLVGYVV